MAHSQYIATIIILGILNTNEFYIIYLLILPEKLIKKMHQQLAY